MRSHAGGRLLWLAAAVVALGCSCSSGSSDDRSGSRAAAPEAHTLPTPETSTTASPGRGLPIATLAAGWPEARPLDVQVGHHPGQRFLAQAPMGDRPVLLGWIQQDPPPPPTADTSPVGGIGVGALDARTGDLQVLHRFATPQFQATTPDSEGDWVVWAEDDSASMSMANWTIWAHDLHSHHTHRVAAHPADAPVSPLVDPTISHGVVAWSAVTAGGRLDAFTAPVVGGPVTDELTDAAEAHVAWPYLAAIHITGSGPDQSSTVVVLDLRDHHQAPVAGTNGARSIALTSTRLVWLVGESGRSVYEADVDGRHRRLLDTGHTPQFPSAGDGVVAWDGYDDGPMLVQEGRPRILNLVHQQTTVWAKGHYVLWPVRDGSALRYQLLDVSPRST